jgi:transcriptional regulator with XRE-family HTH domain
MDPVPELPFGERLDRWLTYFGMRQSTFARLIDVKPPTVNAWVAGREAPRSDRLPSIAAALKMSLAAFFGELPAPGVVLDPKERMPEEKKLPPHPDTGDITREIRFDVSDDSCPTCGHKGEAA